MPAPTTGPCCHSSGVILAEGNDIKLILLGGTSHVGKSTLGRRLADANGWNHLSTDQLARHPGRPWTVGGQPVPDDVVRHYRELSVQELVDSVLAHYRNNVWPIVAAIVRSRLNNPFDSGLVFEGSAILPELVTGLSGPRVRAVWLTAPHQLIEQRIKEGSNYETRSTAERRLIDAFLERTIEFDRQVGASARLVGQEILDVSAADALAALQSLPGPRSRCP